jgi:hypothetical protein
VRRALLAAATLALAASGFGAAVSAAGVDAQDVGDITEPTSILAADSTFPIITATGANADYTVFNVTGPYPNFSFSRSETNNRSSASSSFFSGELALYSCGTVGCGVPPDTIPTASLIASGLISGKTPLAMTGFYQTAAVAWSDVAKGPHYTELLGTASQDTALFPSANLTVSPIPEASTWAMLALGFVGLGYAAFRRSARGQLTSRGF